MHEEAPAEEPRRLGAIDEAPRYGQHHNDRGGDNRERSSVLCGQLRHTASYRGRREQGTEQHAADPRIGADIDPARVVCIEQADHLGQREC